MVGLIARSLLALALGMAFIIAMLLALAGDALSTAAARRRQMQTLQRRNRELIARSDMLTAEEIQS